MTFLGFDQLEWEAIGLSVLIFVGAVLFGRWLIRRILLPIAKRIIGRTQTTVDDLLLDAIIGPVYWLLLLTVAQYSLARLDFLDTKVQLTLVDAYFVLYLVILYVLASRVISKMAAWLITVSSKGEENLGKQLLPFLTRVMLLVATLIAGIILLGHFNVEVGGLVATLGIGSLAIALAAQETLSDTIAGFVIMLDKPFRIGDRIEMLELGTWGDVMDIGMRSTRIRTRDNRMAIIPNSVIGKSLVVNHSYPDKNYRLEIEIGVAYGSDLEKVRKVLTDAVRKVEGVMQELPVEALFLSFGEFSLVFRVRWWLDSFVDTRRMFDRVNTSMYEALSASEIELPFPQRVVHHKFDDKQGKRMTEFFQKDK